MIERLSLNSLKFFFYVAQLGSVTLAAEKLFVTQSAVSKQIRRAEQSIGVELFDRRHKAIKLTPKGVLLYESCRKVFAELEDCLININQKGFQSHQLILSCEPTLSMKWLIPRLAQFKALGHDFEVVLVTGGGPVSFEKNNIDIAIRRDDFDWAEALYSVKLADEYLLWVKHAYSAENSDLLISTSRPHFIKNLSKNLTVKQQLKEYALVELEHFYLCLEGVLAGLGDSILSIYMIEKELECRLLNPKIPMQADGSAYYLLSNQAFEHDSRKIIFLEWLQMEMQRSQMKLMALLDQK